MLAGIKTSIRIIFCFLFALFLTACGSDSSTENSASADLNLPGEIAKLKLSDTGSIRAYVTVDGGTQTEMTVSGSTASIQLSGLSEGSHQFTIKFEYVLNSDPGNPIILAEVTKPGTVSSTNNNTLSFVESDFIYADYDDDNDGISNLDEMQSGGTAPLVIAVTPADASTGNASNVVIDITFDDPMIETTITTSSFTVSGVATGVVTGSVSYDSDTKTASFTPASALMENETYTASVSTEVMNSADMSLAAIESWSFTVEDLTAPVVSTLSPVDGNTDVVANTTIDITFDDPMDDTTITTSSFTVSGTTIGAVSGVISYDGVTNTAIFTPAQVLKAYETYTITVTTAVQNTASIALASNESWSFTIQEPPVQQISTVQTSGATTTPILEYNAAGDGIAIWEVSNIGRSLVYSIYDLTTDSWSTEAILTSNTNSSSMTPQLVSNGNGFALVWREYDGTVYQLYSSLFDGTDWSIPTIIDTEDSSAYGHQLVSNGTGYAVTWYQQQGGDNHIFARIDPDGTGWGSAVVIDNAMTSAISPRIASNGTDYAVIWQQDSPTQIGVNVYSGSWSSATAGTLDSGTYSSYGHEIVSNGDGYSVIWSEYDGTINKLLNRTYYNSGGYLWSPVADIGVATENSFSNGINSITSNGTGYAVSFTQYNTTDYIYNAYAVINAAGNADWGAPSLLETETGSISGSPMIVSNGSTYAALWSQYDGASTYDLFSSVYSGTGWSGGAAIEAASGPVYSSYFDLEATGSRYIATWYQELGGINDIFANVYDGGWGLVEALETDDNGASKPTIESNPAGGLTVAWSQTGAGVFSNHYTTASGWSGEVALTTTAFGGSSYNPTLLANGNGQTLAVWRQYSGSQYNLYSNIHENGIWGQPQVLSTGSTGQAHTATNGSSFVVVWSENDGTFNSIYARIFDGDWSNKQEVDDDSLQASAYIPGINEGVAVASNGNSYMLVYRQYDGSSYHDIFARNFDGTSWGSPQLLDDATINTSAYSPSITSNGTGYLVLWLQYDGTFSRVFSNEFNGSSWEITPQLLENSGNGFNYYPSHLVSNGDSYLAVWSQYDGVAQYHAYANFYSSGSWGTPSQLNSGTAGNQVYSKPQAVHSTADNYAVVWSEWVDSSSLYQVITTIYDGSVWATPTVLDDGMQGYTKLDTYSNRALVSNGGGYAVIWSRSGGSVYDAFSSVFDASWSVATALETGLETVNQLTIASNGDGFLVAWQQDNGSGIFDIVANRYDPLTGWNGEAALDSDALNSAFELQLTGTIDGYLGTWTQPEPTGDPSVRFPWSKILF